MASHARGGNILSACGAFTTTMTPATALETTVAVQGDQIRTLRRQCERYELALERIEEKLDDLKDGLNNRMLSALGAAVVGLATAVWSVIKTKG